MRKLIICLFIIFSMFYVYSESIKLYEGTYLISETDESGVKYNYTYLDGLLLFTTIEDESEVSVEYYLRNPVDYSLVAVKRGEVLNTLEPEYPYKGNFTNDEDGNIVYVENDTIYTYTVSGQVLKEEKEGVLIEYVYNEEDVLTCVSTTTGTEVNKEYYSNGRLGSYEKFNNGTIAESGLYSNDGLTKTIYNRGKAIARIMYASDLVKVLKVEYL